MKITVQEVRCDVCGGMILSDPQRTNIVNINNRIFDICDKCLISFDDFMRFIDIKVGVPISYMHIGK